MRQMKQTKTVEDLIRELGRFEPTARVVIYDAGLGIHREPVCSWTVAGRGDPGHLELL